MLENTEKNIYKQLANFKQNFSICDPVGWVQVYNDKLLVEEKSNLVLGQGRSVSAQRLFDTNITQFFQEEPDYTNHIVSHFGVGSGGSVITSNDTYTLQGPHICDMFLYRPISLGNITMYLSEQRDFNQSDLHNSNYVIKPIEEKTLVEHSFPSQNASEEFDEDDTCSYYTKVKCICSLGEEPAALGSNETVQISEAGLYAVRKDFSETGDDPMPILFAHICFSPQFKLKEKTFGLVWYILC